MASSNDNSNDESLWVVVETGCNRGRNWSRAAMIVRSDRSRSDRTYPSRDEAVKAARAKRNRNDFFTDACAPDPNDSDYDSEDYDGSDDSYEYQFSNTDEPPWDSADLQNWDNDEEVRFEVMTVAEFEKQEADDAAYVRRERMRHQYEGTIEHVMLGMQIKDAGRVFYTQPPSPNSIKAELEIFDYEVEDDGETEKKGNYVPKKVDIPPNASSIKSLMYKGGDAFQKYTRKFRWEKISEETEDAKAEDFEASGLLCILKACTSLEELHIQCTNFNTFISPVLLLKMQTAAPHLARTLKVLSIRSPLQLEPDALAWISDFERLERLDISDAFSAEFYQDNYDYDCDHRTMSRPYDDQMMECIRSLTHLKRLDLGYGDGESQRHLYNYMLGRNIVSELEERSSYGDFEFTMNYFAKPEEWSSMTRKKAARYHALVKVFEDETADEDIRAMAEEELKTCPTCKNPAAKRCTGCKREFYCSVTCQKSDFKEHKKVCVERFN